MAFDTPREADAPLVVLAPNWLGDAVMALPAIADVRRALPSAALAVAARPSVAPLFALVPGVETVITLERGRWRLRPGPLQDGRFQTALLFPNSLQAALLARQAGIASRWGYRTDCRGALLTRAVEPPSGAHQVDYYRALVSELGFPNGDAEPRLAVPADAKATATLLLQSRGWDGRRHVAAIAPGAAYGGAKRWPPSSFAALAAACAGDGVDVVMVGSGADRETANEVMRAFERSGRRSGSGATLLDVVGATDLATLTGLLALSRSLVTNDSGAMHLAAAVGTPVTAVFGPTNERGTGLRGGGHSIVTGEAWCRPCMLRECPIDHRCMRSIEVAPVLEAARRSW
jgi:heptosyltransferase-2